MRGDLRKCLLLAVLCLFVGGRAWGATVNYTGPGTAWNDGANWLGGTVPTADDDVIIDVNLQVDADITPINFASLTLGNISGTTAPTLRMLTSWS